LEKSGRIEIGPEKLGFGKIGENVSVLGWILGMDGCRRWEDDWRLILNSEFD
jgi:hypothetical protein